MRRTGSAARAPDERLRLTVITAREPRAGSLTEVVAECVEAGATTIQLRDKRSGSRELFEKAVELRPIVQSGGALFIVNDRFDVAIAAAADGAHLGPDDVPLAAARAALSPEFILGYSTDDPVGAKQAEVEGADYLGVGSLFGTTSKPGLEDEAIGPEGLLRVADAVGIPCVGIGGVTPDNARSVADCGAGVAVLSCVMEADRPGDVVRALLAAMGTQRE